MVDENNIMLFCSAFQVHDSILAVVKESSSIPLFEDTNNRTKFFKYERALYRGTRDLRENRAFCKLDKYRTRRLCYCNITA